jgi:hypothetical protein
LNRRGINPVILLDVPSLWQAGETNCALWNFIQEHTQFKQYYSLLSYIYMSLYVSGVVKGSIFTNVGRDFVGVEHCNFKVAVSGNYNSFKEV